MCTLKSLSTRGPAGVTHAISPISFKLSTFVAKNSGGVKKKPMIILKDLIFIRFSFNKRRQRLAGVRGFTMK